MNARCSGSFALWLSLASVSIGADLEVPRPTHPTPQTAADKGCKLSAFEHLRIAAEQLEAAGLTEEAAKIRLASDHLTELEKKSPRLQQLTGRPTQIACNCRFVKLSTKAAAEFDAAAELASPWTKPRDRTAPSLAVYKNVETTLQRLRATGKVTSTHEEPQIVTTHGRRASAMTGGEFPILIPTGGDHHVSVDWRWFGTRCEIVPYLLDAGRIRLEMTVETVDRDLKHAVTATGLTIPGLTTRRAQPQVEMNFGETLVIGYGSNQAAEAEDSPHTIRQAVMRLANAELDAAPAEDTVTLFMVTPVAVNSSSN